MKYSIIYGNGDLNSFLSYYQKQFDKYLVINLTSYCSFIKEFENELHINHIIIVTAVLAHVPTVYIAKASLYLIYKKPVLNEVFSIELLKSKSMI